MTSRRNLLLRCFILFLRVGEEREKAREELDKERRQYEEQILKLIEQQEQILKERHGNVLPMPF